MSVCRELPGLWSYVDDDRIGVMSRGLVLACRDAAVNRDVLRGTGPGGSSQFVRGIIPNGGVSRIRIKVIGQRVAAAVYHFPLAARGLRSQGETNRGRSITACAR